MTKPIIDSEFHALIPPLSDDERAQLEANILAEGCRDALVIWDGIILDGHNRFEICERLKMEYRTKAIELKDRAAAVEWIIRNQFGRRNLSAYQRAELALKLEPIIAAKAKDRMLAGKSDPVQKSSQGKTRESLASVAGVSHDTIHKAKVIAARADDETKARLRSGDTSINAEYKKIKKETKAEERKSERAGLIVTMPSGKYAVILADPPWQYKNSGFNESAESQYQTMSTEDICAMAGIVNGFSTPETVIFMWATNPLLPDALKVMAAWGYEYKTNMAWIKDQGRGRGWFLKSKHELILIGTRANTPHPKERPDSCFEADRGPVHSRKPQAIYDIIESMYDGAKLEMFCREPHKGWASHGNEL